MAVINTGLLQKGLKSNFFARLGAVKTYYQDWATRIESTADSETYKWLGATPRMREWGTGRLAKGLRTESYSVENLKYESTIEVDRDEISDDQTGQIKIRVEELALAAGVHKDFLISQLLINGETSGFNSYDGVSFFNDAHISGASGSQDNKLTFAGVTDVTDPTTDNFKAALKQAIGQMLGFKNDVGDPAHMDTGGLVCVVPTTMYFTALEAVRASVISNTSNVMEGIATVTPFPWLTDLSKWYLLKTGGNTVVRPFVFQDREPIEFVALDEGSDESFRREKFLYGVRARYALSFGMWMNAISTDFTV